jgi:hypothetical protein
MDKAEVIQSIRVNYQMIYEWHTKKGIKIFKKVFEELELDNKDLFNKYINFINDMPAPNYAEIEAISHVAHEVLGGCLEWSYTAEIEPNLQMHLVANNIKKLLLKLHESEFIENKFHKLNNLKNTTEGQEEVKPDFVEITIPSDDMTIDKYFECASIAYSDVMHSCKVENIGGKVVLSDTNLEHEHTRSRHSNEGLMIKFRNSKAMHFEEEKGKDSIVNLAKSGTISIISVKIGG